MNKRVSAKFQATNSSIACWWPRLGSGEPRLHKITSSICSKSEMFQASSWGPFPFEAFGHGGPLPVRRERDYTAWNMDDSPVIGQVHSEAPICWHSRLTGYFRSDFRIVPGVQLRAEEAESVGW